MNWNVWGTKVREESYLRNNVYDVFSLLLLYQEPICVSLSGRPQRDLTTSFHKQQQQQQAFYKYIILYLKKIYQIYFVPQQVLIEWRFYNLQLAAPFLNIVLIFYIKQSC